MSFSLPLRTFLLSEIPREARLIISNKGQIMLPASMRRELGLTANTLVTAEQQGGRIVLTPAIVVETEHYSDADTANWVREDRFGSGERELLTTRLKNQTKRVSKTKLKTKPDLKHTVEFKPKANLKPGLDLKPNRKAKTKRAPRRRA